MAKVTRGSTKKINTPATIMQNGWVIINPIKTDRLTEYSRTVEGLDSRDPNDADVIFKLNQDLVAEHLVDWNWVDGSDSEDSSMPIPKTGIDVGEMLYARETLWIVQQITKTDPK